MEWFQGLEDWGLAALEWVRLNPGWLLVALCFFAFAESLAFMGILIPGIVILAGLGTIAATSDVHVLLTLALIFIGAVLGDGLSYLIGYRMHRRVHRMQFFQDRPHWLPTAERVFARFGIPALAFGRFIGPLRPVLPITAGVLRLSPRIFIPLNLVTGLAWATIVTLPAYQLSDYLQAGQWTPAIMLVCGVLLLAGVAILVAARLRKL